MRNVIDFLESSKYSDFTITAGSYVFRVHKLVVSCGSEFFDKVCSNGFKESLDGAVTLQDDDPILVARLLLYFYTSDYEPPEIKQDILGKIMNRAASSVNNAQPHEDESQMIVAAQMYGIAEKYGIKDLKDLCVERFATGVKKASMTDLLALVDVVYEQAPD